jgi:two-component system, chemotaxis family, protein-glutamate methylesterase/glutaminase
MAYELIAVGTSLGGFHALKTALGPLDKAFPVPIAVVQHRSQEDSESFVPLLAGHMRLPMVEVEDKLPISERCIYICPSNYHLLVDQSCFALSTDGPVMYARPSIDVFFESAAESFRERVIGVLLTGMSRDGTQGLKKIKENGGYAVVQDPAAAEGPVMPQAAIDSVDVDQILPLEEIASFLQALCAGQRTEV